MNENIISKLLAISMALGITSGKYNDYYLFGNERLMDYSISLIIEIDELLDKGYTKDEIATIIKGCNFCNIDSELTKEEGKYLKSYSIKMLDIRYDLCIKEQNIKKLYKKYK